MAQYLSSKYEMLIISFFPLGETIAQLTDVASLDHPESDSHITIFTDKTGVVKAARLLLSSVTKVLVLADRIVIKQIITSRNKVFVASFFFCLTDTHSQCKRVVVNGMVFSLYL